MHGLVSSILIEIHFMACHQKKQQIYTVNERNNRAQANFRLGFAWMILKHFAEIFAHNTDDRCYKWAKLTPIELRIIMVGVTHVTDNKSKVVYMW